MFEFIEHTQIQYINVEHQYFQNFMLHNSYGRFFVESLIQSIRATKKTLLTWESFTAWQILEVATTVLYSTELFNRDTYEILPTYVGIIVNYILIYNNPHISG